MIASKNVLVVYKLFWRRYNKNNKTPFKGEMFEERMEEIFMKTNKIIAAALMAIMSIGAVSGCDGGQNAAKDDGKTVITIGDCPAKETEPENYELMLSNIELFEKEHPDVKVKMDTWHFDTQTYMAKAEGNTLPTIYTVPLTEAKSIMSLNYAADITEEFKARGFYDNINDFMLENISKDGRVYFLPTDCYDVGLVMNIDLLEQAGYIQEDGTPVEPQTWQELAEMAVKIKQITGKNGFILPTMGNCGGWRFTPIAWSYGVEFMKQNADGKWVATFDSAECVEALQFIKDLKWKYDVLPVNTLVDLAEVQKQMAIGESAMTLAEPNQIDQFAQFGMNPDSIGVVRIPSGPKKRVSLMGGAYFVINSNSTPEQIKAAFDWREFMGDTMELTDSIKEVVAKNIEIRKTNNNVIGLDTLSPWKADCEVITYKKGEYEKNANVNMNHIKLYNNKVGVEYQAEEPVEAQALYAQLDTCIQEVLTNKDANCAELIHKAAADFQKNYLD